MKRVEFICRPTIELLEDRTVPAFIASQLPIASVGPLTLTTAQVNTLLERAAAATSTDNAIVAIVDRAGDILGVRVEGNVSPAITGNSNILDFSIDGAASLARTAAFFSSDADPLTSRTVQFISQSTITQREVNSYSFVSNPASTIGGPGFVAPIGIGGHFPPGVADTPQVDLFGIENTNRQMLVNPGASGILNTPGDAALGPNDGPYIQTGANVNVPLAGQFNVPGLNEPDTLSYFDTLLGAGATVATGGTGYKVGDVLTTTSAGFTTPAQLTVLSVNAGGAITTVEVSQQGQNATALTNVSVSGGHGTGAKFNFTADNQNNASIAHMASRGIATLPGGIPIYEDGVLVGGIGVFFPGTTGFATAENSQLSAGYNPKAPDLSMEAEFIALAAVGGSTQAGFPIGTLGGVPALPGFNLPSPNISLAGITLDTVGPGGQQGPRNLVNYIKANFSIGTGKPGSGINEPVDFTGNTLLPGIPPPSGWLVAPHAGGNLTAAEVTQMINQGIAQANQTRSQIRPLGDMASMVFAVTDNAGAVLGLYRMPDAPIFSIDVAVSKARNDAYYDNPASPLNASEKLAGIPAGAAFTSRTFRFLALPNYPEGINQDPPGPWSILNDPGTNTSTGLSVGAAQPISAFTSVLGFDAFHPNTNFNDFGADSSGVVFFPGSSPVYINGKPVGGLGVSGDGVDEDDVIASLAIAGFDAPEKLRADQFSYRGVRLPYFKFDRNPEG